MKKIKMVNRACPLCSSRDETRVFAVENYDPSSLDDFAFSSRKMPEHMHYRLVTCPVCDLAYANPLPTLKDIAKSYQEADFDSSEEAHHAARTYARALPHIMERIGKTEGALDIGTGDGAFLEELLKKGFTHVVGVEPSRAPILASLPQIKPLIRPGLFNRKHFKANSLSLVTCFQTLEHLSEPLEVCRSAGRLLKKGGAFLSVCHDRTALSARLLGQRSPIFDVEHLQLFSPKSARALLSRSGLARIEIRRIFNTYPVHYWTKLLPLPKRAKLSLIAGLKAVRIGHLPIPLPAGNMAIVGYK
jgi:SAM-dependent methyltransferase